MGKNVSRNAFRRKWQNLWIGTRGEGLFKVAINEKYDTYNPTIKGGPLFPTPHSLSIFGNRTRKLMDWNKGWGLNFYRNAKKSNHKIPMQKRRLLSTTNFPVLKWISPVIFNG